MSVLKSCDAVLFFLVHTPSLSVSPDEDEDGDSITVRNDDELVAMLQYVRTLCYRHVIAVVSCQ